MRLLATLFSHLIRQHSPDDLLQYPLITDFNALVLVKQLYS